MENKIRQEFQKEQRKIAIEMKRKIKKEQPQKHPKKRYANQNATDKYKQLIKQG